MNIISMTVSVSVRINKVNQINMNAGIGNAESCRERFRNTRRAALEISC